MVGLQSSLTFDPAFLHPSAKIIIVRIIIIIIIRNSIIIINIFILSSSSPSSSLTASVGSHPKTFSSISSMCAAHFQVAHYHHHHNHHHHHTKTFFLFGLYAPAHILVEASAVELEPECRHNWYLVDLGLRIK